jgi:ArsR family transcriptional regulator
MIVLSTFDMARFEASAAAAARLLRALANERRLMILCQLTAGDHSVSELLPLIGVSHFRSRRRAGHGDPRSDILP